MATALEIPNIVIAPISDHGSGARITSKEIITNKSTAFRLISLEIAIGSCVHQINQCALRIHRKKRIPLASPNNLDYIPTGTSK